MNLTKLKKEQIRLAKKVSLKDSIKISGIKTIGSCDQAFYKDKIISVIIVFKYPSRKKLMLFSSLVNYSVIYKPLKIIEKKYSIIKEKFPYISGYLSYREVPAIIKTYKKLKNKPDILLCDFNGILHPRKIGAASHLGVLLDICTIGVAKSLLCGKIKNDYVYINDEKAGYKLKNNNFKPIYVSPGNKISLKSSIEIAKKLIKNNRLPEPLRLAHVYVNKIKKKKLCSIHLL